MENNIPLKLVTSLELKLDAELNSVVNFDVLYINDEGAVLTGSDVQNAKVVANVVSEGKDKKVVVYKYKSKKNIRKRQGHRQPYTAVQITEIVK